MIQRLAIVGLGLLGGSVAKAVRERGLAGEIVGVGRERARLEPAVTDGSVDGATTDLAAGVREADFVVLATPVQAIERLLATVWQAVPAATVITDVGSTKASVVRAAERLAAGRPLGFVGSHPMAGSERSGYAVARADLFEDATVVVTPTEATDPRALKTVTAFWEALGARVLSLAPASHDRCVAAISHLPHLLAMALVDGVNRFEPEALELAARGFKDTTRIAASEPRVWREIFLTNGAAVIQSLTGFRRALAELEGLIAAGDGAALQAALERIRKSREALG